MIFGKFERKLCEARGHKWSGPVIFAGDMAFESCSCCDVDRVFGMIVEKNKKKEIIELTESVKRMTERYR